MKIEHFGLQVDDPGAMAEWYVANLKFTIQREAESPNPVRFIADSNGEVMIEIYHNPMVGVPDYFSMDPLILHIAYVCADVDGETERLVAAGASVATEARNTDAGDRLAMLRDPWGVPLQLCNRSKSMV